MLPVFPGKTMIILLLSALYSIALANAVVRGLDDDK